MTLTDTFQDLHDRGTFVLPNPWDIGSARLFQAAGFPAVATTSAGLAATLGRRDQHLTRAEVISHVRDLTAALDIPLSVDAEDGYGQTPADVAATVRALGDAGAAGCSIEDYDATAGRIRPLDQALDRVKAAVQAADGMVVTARCEHHLYGVEDLDATIERLVAFVDAGAGCVYAPGLTDPAAIGRVVDAVDAPVNVLAMPGGPTVEKLTRLGVRRVSVGSWLTMAAYGTALTVARSLMEGGGIPSDVARPRRGTVEAAWGEEDSSR